MTGSQFIKSALGGTRLFVGPHLVKPDLTRGKTLSRLKQEK